MPTPRRRLPPRNAGLTVAAGGIGLRTRARPLAAALWLATACESRDAAPAPPRDDAAARAGAPAPAGEVRVRPPDRRGDRHARAAAQRTPLREVAGTVVRADDRQVVVRPRGASGGELALRVAPRTTVTVGGRAARAAELRPGADVRAAYRTVEGGRATAISIEAAGPPSTTAPAPARPGDDRPVSDG